MIELQPYIDTLTDALVALLVATLLGVVALLKGKITAWLDARTSAQQREILHRLAGEAAALVEATYKELDGPRKLTQAYAYVLERAKDAGITINHETIRAAIEKAVLDYNAKVKGGGSNANQG